MTEKTLTNLNLGKHAELALHHLGPIIDLNEHNALEELKSNFRSGKYTEASLASGVAKVIAYSDLRDELKRKIIVGNKAAKELTDGNK